MTITTNHENADLNVVLTGRLDSVTANELDNVLQKELTQDTTSLTVNLKEIDFISSKGLRVLVAAYKKLTGKPMTLVGANPSVLEVLRLSGLLKIFTIKEN